MSGKKGAGILRAKPNINWKKDRGKEPYRDKAEYPWFWYAEEPPLSCPRRQRLHRPPLEQRPPDHRAKARC